jgi:hypothetical protein
VQAARTLREPMRRLLARRIGKHRNLIHQPLFETDALPVFQVNRGNYQHFD